MSAPRSAVVVGGGIAGSATAIALTKAGIATTVLEARSTAADLDGVMLTVATNGINALRAIDADHCVTGLGFPTPTITLRTHTGKRLGDTFTGGLLPDGTQSQTVRRADLSAALRDEARRRGVTIREDSRVERVAEHPHGVRAVLADGAVVESDILIGADGVHSTVRSYIDPEAPRPAYAGLLTTGGYASAVEVDANPGGYEMIFGRRAFFGYAVAPDGEIWWFVNLPEPKEPPRTQLRAVPAQRWRETFQRVYADDAGPALNLVAATPDFAPMTSIHTMAHLPRWHTDRMIVVGDAAHAPSPTSGQGASLSIEDAVVLATALRDARTPAEAFAGFESVRRPRVEKIIKAAARINNTKAPGPVGRLLRDLMLPTILRLTADTKSARETYEYRVEWAGPGASALGSRTELS